MSLPPLSCRALTSGRSRPSGVDPRTNPLLNFDTFGNVSLIQSHIATPAQPIWVFAAQVNLGFGDNNGAIPHVTGARFPPP